MYVDQIMTSDVLVVEEDAKNTHIAGLMQAKRIRHLPVVNQAGHLVGILSHRDVQKASPSDMTTLSVGEVNYLLSKLKAKDIMHKDVLSCTPDTLVEDAAMLMREKTIGCLPVVQNDKLVGILTSVDLLDFFLDITGCRAKDSTRISANLVNRQGGLYQFLGAINEQGARIVSVVTPETGSQENAKRSVIVRFRAPNPAEVDQKLREAGFEITSETLPE